MDDHAERLIALEATQRAEVRELHNKIDHHVQELQGEVFRIRAMLKELDECIDNRLAAVREALLRDVKVQVEFPKRVAWLIVAAILTSVLGGAGTIVAVYVFRVGTESQRTITLPTTPPLREGMP